MPQEIINLLNLATEANISDNFRRGNLICLPAEGTVVITGDIHGHRRNLERILKFADLANNIDRHVVLQEIIHGGPQDSQGGCLSYKMLFEVVRYKLRFPDRVHILMGNHDTAFISNSEVMKNGKEMNRSIRSALGREFRRSAADVESAIKQFLLSQPLAVRCDNRIWLSHSLPDDANVEMFDAAVMERQLEINDFVKPGSAYLLTWGRNISQSLLDRMAELFDIDIFVLGHQPQQDGWTAAGRNLIIIASDHNHGCLLLTDLTKSYTLEELRDAIVPLASLR